VVIDPAVPITEWGLSERGRARIRAGLTQPWLGNITSIWSSDERKAIETAAIVAGAVGLIPVAREDLGENDRSATGYLPFDEFDRAVDQFFAEPEQSVRGWATAAAEQQRIVRCFEDIRKAEPDGMPLIVSHGAVGALLLAYLSQCPVSRIFDQPGNGGGNWFHADERRPAWRPFDGCVR
tara:strand:+ start:322 stop:861 length:540 start_codon:yes stop_codon:yes gene_type:complete